MRCFSWTVLRAVVLCAVSFIFGYLLCGLRSSAPGSSPSLPPPPAVECPVCECPSPHHGSGVPSTSSILLGSYLDILGVSSKLFETFMDIAAQAKVDFPKKRVDDYGRLALHQLFYRLFLTWVRGVRGDNGGTQAIAIPNQDDNWEGVYRVNANKWVKDTMTRKGILGGGGFWGSGRRRLHCLEISPRTYLDSLKPPCDKRWMLKFGEKVSVNKGKHELVMDIDAHDVPDELKGTIDLLICTFTMEHVKDPKRATETLVKFLKPGGVIISTAPFVFPKHAYPEDNYRYSSSGLAHMWDRFGNLCIEEISRGCGHWCALSEVMRFIPEWLPDWVAHQINDGGFYSSAYVVAWNPLPGEKCPPYPKYDEHKPRHQFCKSYRYYC